MNGMICCKVCKSTRFRRTHFEPEDRLQLALLRYPVRCRQCGKRIRTSIFSAFFYAVPRSAPHMGAGDTWTTYTSGTDLDNPTVKEMEERKSPNKSLKKQ